MDNKTGRRVLGLLLIILGAILNHNDAPNLWIFLPTCAGTLLVLWDIKFSW